MHRTDLPEFLIRNRQRSVAYDGPHLAELVKKSLPLCLGTAARAGGPLAGLSGVEFSVLGTRAMARVHREFLGIPGATDVITFPYGEILVCAPVAAARAPEFGHTVTTEIALYCIHGLLHLAGLDDREPADASRMAEEQNRILRAIL